MKTKFINSEITVIKQWAKDANIHPDYITIYRYPKLGVFNYRVMIADEHKSSVMDFLNPNGELFDTISLSRQLAIIFKSDKSNNQ